MISRELSFLHRNGDLLPPDIFCEPLPVMPYGCQPFLWLGDAMTETLVDDQPGGYLPVLETAVQFMRIGDRYTRIQLPMLYLCRSRRLVDRCHRRGLFIDGLVLPRSGF